MRTSVALDSALDHGRIRLALREAAVKGHAYVPSILDAATLTKLRQELATLGLTTAPERVGSVCQVAETVALTVGELSHRSPIAALAAQLADAFRPLAASEFNGRKFVATEATVMRYRQRDVGITPHRDHRRYRKVVVVFSITGMAIAGITRSRERQDLEAGFTCHPGDLLLLRAPGLAGLSDGRPMHFVDGPQVGERTSLSFRMTAPGRGDR